MKKIIEKEFGKEVTNFLSNYVNWEDDSTLVVCTSTVFNIENQPVNKYKAIVNLKKINNILRINNFFITVNSKLPLNGIFIGCSETYSLRTKRIFIKYPKPIAWIIYLWWFFYRRVCPKLPYFKKIYFFLTHGVNRVMSKAEVLGRLISCGYEITEIKECNNLLYFVARKIKESPENIQPTYGILLKLKRVGKNGKIIKVYKFRTMHPYSEFLQEYIYKHYNIEEGGKFKNDFRITEWGRFFRKFWIDELPMLINIIKGDLKLVGVRPLSQQYFSLYSPELQKMRIKHKPGLIPPYYVDMPKTLEEIEASEKKYLQAYEKNPIITDIKYLFLALNNIIFKKARSK